MNKPLRHTPFQYQAGSKAVSDPQLTYTELMGAIQALPEQELVRFVRSYVQERTPAAFAAQPLLWEAVRDFVAARSGVHAREVGLSGSAQVGFAVAKGKAGQAFDPNGSDLDLFLVNSSLFSSIEKEARLFVSRQAEGSKFTSQAATVGRQIERGYIDLNQVPADDTLYPTISRGRNDASIVIDRLRCHNFTLKPSHLRVYRDWRALGGWVALSFKSIMK